MQILSELKISSDSNRETTVILAVQSRLDCQSATISDKKIRR